MELDGNNGNKLTKRCDLLVMIKFSFKEAYSVARQFNLIPPICEQTEYNMFQREDAELNLPDIYNRIGIGTMTWSPLASGILSGKYEDGIPPNSRASLKVAIIFF